ncbi:MAG: hypothetical protein ACD_20C00162G0005 [uncultured bacterium]|nr:MAG: hypothetical protein ACD_20C00162G0005 [uncultured bacterium]
MTGYIVSFTVYTLAMIGVLLIGFIVVKKSLIPGYNPTAKNKFLSVETSLSLEPRKNLYIVKAGSERFLISTDAQSSNFLAKLDADNMPVIEESADHKSNKVNPDLNMAFPVLNFTKKFLRKDFVSQRPFKTKFIEKLNMYVTFQRP